ncbi:PQ loop repeat protein [Gaeumannomyces tritici R3-111a-1]|uniref:PQ loop repeat protein n=1 Tax=Gaeumannomyces tritici (strain R3-111a-1) TaxID=644352 RepID=J3NGV5_GAET3|nr:PQ loop repeat protein [Gaeumannomyces tritici R3-111a-1]EJT80495.1 PQ loop repeat protein [Gaeumannomyces tritici R3-111a-1]
MGFFSALAANAAPIFLTVSPILSYSDQAWSMHKARSSAGFSLDIPLILIVASLLRIFYYPGAQFDQALLVQAVTMVAMQTILLKVALDHRPGPSHKGGDAAAPFASSQGGALQDFKRPYNFWQWRSHKPYWQFILYLFIGLTILELLLAPLHSVYALYSPLVGYLGLAAEATVPFPQMYANARTRSCRGFRPSIIVSWIMGDCMKMCWFFTSPTEIPVAFKVCGVFQAACDLFLGMQYLQYGTGGPEPSSKRAVGLGLDDGHGHGHGHGHDHHHQGHQMQHLAPNYGYGGGSSFKSPNGQLAAGFGEPATGRRTPNPDKGMLD